MSSGGDNSGKGNKRKKRHSKYLQHAGKKSTISAGVQGFLLTCVGGKERVAIKEAINLLDQFYEGIENKTSSGPEGEATRPVAVPYSCQDGVPLESRADSSGAPADAEDDDDDDDGACSDSSAEDSDGETLGWVKSRKLEDSGNAQRSSVELAELKKLEEKNATQSSTVTVLRTKKTTEPSKSFDELLAEELDDLRDTKKARFVGYETGCNGVIFVRMHSEKGVQNKGPMELAEAIVREAAMSKQSRTRFCMRLLPVELTCYASTAEILKVAQPLIRRHFPSEPDQPSIKFAVICEARANTNLNKMDFINTMAKLVPQPHSVDLRNPEKTILVQVVKTACAIGVVQDFKELAKYNLRQLTLPPERSRAQGKDSTE